MRNNIADLDDADRRLLNELQRDAARPNAVLADAAGLSPSACYRRVQRLREVGLITKQVALVDPKLSPWPLVVIIEVELERLNEASRSAFAARIQAVPQIMQCYAVSGDADFIMVVQLSGTDDYRRFVHEVFIGDENVKHFKSTFTVHTLKRKTEIDF